MRVFVAEDAPEVRKRLVAMVRVIPGIEVVGEAASVRDAVDGTLASAADVLLLDLQLTDGSGLDVLAGVKRRRPELRVIVLTNYPSAQHRQACQAAGSEMFLDKSQEFGRVPETLRVWLDEHDQPPANNRTAI
jgi:two-component system, NarL family, response regulator DevR